MNSAEPRRHLDRITPTRWAAGPLAALLILAVALSTPANSAVLGAEARPTALPVAGTGVHYFSTSIVHAQVPTETGMIQRSSDIVTLQGDLNGHLLYHPTSTFDYAAGTLINRGTQFFSGTVLDSDPVILHDDRFRFEVDLATGATTGVVHLRRSSDAPRGDTWFECDLQIVGTGLTPDGDATFSYDGSCARSGA